MQPVLAAALWMIGAILSFSALAVAGREAMAGLSIPELLFYRSLAGIAIVLAVAALTSGAAGLFLLPGRRYGLHLLRNGAHFAGQMLWYFALASIPLAQVFALEFTSPIWAVLMAPLLLGERLTTRALLTALVGFVGILIVARPAPGAIDAGTLAAALAAIGFAGSAVFTRRLTRHAGTLEILLWMSAMQALMALAAALFDTGAIRLPAAGSLPFVLMVAMAGLSAHFCLTRALSLAPASTVIPLDFARLPLIAIIGMALYGEPLDPFVFIGGAVIFAANYFNIRSESRPEKAKTGAK